MSISPADLGGPYRTVFDVGAFQGDFARACLAEWPDCCVESFEPLLEHPKDVCRYNMGAPAPRWRWHRIALGNACEMVTMHRNVFVPSSSVLPMAPLHEQAFPYTKGSTEERVGMVTLDEFAEVIESPALLKIDVQGYELEVLKGAGDAIIEFDAVVLEVSHVELYHGAPDPERLAVFLRQQGFAHRAWVDELWDPREGHERLLQSDELWVRP